MCGQVGRVVLCTLSQVMALWVAFRPVLKTHYCRRLFHRLDLPSPLKGLSVEEHGEMAVRNFCELLLQCAYHPDGFEGTLRL